MNKKIKPKKITNKDKKELQEMLPILPKEEKNDK